MALDNFRLTDWQSQTDGWTHRLLKHTFTNRSLPGPSSFGTYLSGRLTARMTDRSSLAVYLIARLVEHPGRAILLISTRPPTTVVPDNASPLLPFKTKLQSTSLCTLWFCEYKRCVYETVNGETWGELEIEHLFTFGGWRSVRVVVQILEVEILNDSCQNGT